jgi:hypothetical protein
MKLEPAEDRLGVLIKAVSAVEAAAGELAPGQQVEVAVALSAAVIRLGYAAASQSGERPAGSHVREKDPILTLDEAAVYLRKSRSWLFHNWKRLRLGFLNGGRVMFRQSVLARYLAGCERRSH